MSRKALVITAAIGFVIIITGAIFIFGRKGPSTKTGTQDNKEITISTLPGGWRLVESPAYNISFKIPSAWKITVLENGRGKIEAVFLGAGVNAVVDVVKEDNMDGLTSEELLGQNKDNQATEVNQDSIRGVSYVTKVGSEHNTGFISDSYLLSNKYFPGNQILNASCSLSGPNYKTMIPTCEEIIGSSKFTR